MPYLLDSNILIRVAHRADPLHGVVRAALRTLWDRGESLYYVSQNLVEFWNVSTRPTAARGGLGLSLEETDRRARLIERVYTLVPDSPAVHAEWRRLVVAHGVSGVEVHDARLAAYIRANGIPHILTTNTSDFARYGVTALHPADV